MTCSWYQLRRQAHYYCTLQHLCIKWLTTPGHPHLTLQFDRAAMDQAQTRALAAIQPFVHLATTQKNPTQRFVCDLINRAISAQGTYLFTELLQTPSVQSLRGTDSQPWLTLLEIFSWGTLEEYHGMNHLNNLFTTRSKRLTSTVTHSYTWLA